MARRIRVTVRANAKKPEVTKIADGGYRAQVCAPAQDGKANHALIEVLADHFKAAKSTIKILRGLSSHHRLIEIGE